MEDGTVEHELCPVLVAETVGILRPDPDEADDWAWVEWPSLVQRVVDTPHTLSPWSVAQVGARTVARGPPADRCVDVARPPPPSIAFTAVALRSGVARSTSWPRPSSGSTCTCPEFLDARRHDVPEATDAIDVLSAEIDSLTAAGGKRLRPAFVLAGHLAARRARRRPAAVDAAAAVELLHTFALLHDDVMDRSELRRGRPAAHRSLRRSTMADPRRTPIGSASAPRCWPATSPSCGRTPCSIGSTHTSSRRIGGAAPASCSPLLRTEVIAGQLLDLQIGCSPSADEHDAARIALLKSARYTVTRPLQIGAALAGAPPDVDRAARRLRRCRRDGVPASRRRARPVRRIRRDRQEPACDDLREGKRTLLVLRALRADDRRGTGARASERSGARISTRSTAQRCREVIAASGALASVEAAIDVAIDRAVAPRRPSLRRLARARR